MEFTLTTTMAAPYEQAVAATRAALADNGFGVLTEIDIKATLKVKLDVDVPAQVILGACRPPLAHRALQANPSIAALLPCNVVVRETDGGCVVEAVDPVAMMAIAGSADELHEVAADASGRIRAALDSLATAVSAAVPAKPSPTGSPAVSPTGSPAVSSAGLPAAV